MPMSSYYYKSLKDNKRRRRKPSMQKHHLYRCSALRVGEHNSSELQCGLHTAPFQRVQYRGGKCTDNQGPQQVGEIY